MFGEQACAGAGLSRIRWKCYHLLELLSGRLACLTAICPQGTQGGGGGGRVAKCVLVLASRRFVCVR